jgi:AcrR family transcriptional regulator
VGEVTIAATHDRILDAALAVMTRHGLARLALEDVAREAHVSRQTVYRYVGNRDGLITETILREERAFLDRMRGAAAGHDRLEAALAAAIASALTSAREHPLLDRLLASEPEVLLPFLTDGSGPVLSAARTVADELLAVHVPTLEDEARAEAADAVTRLVISYAISPVETPVDRLAGRLAGVLANGVAPVGEPAPR